MMDKDQKTIEAWKQTIAVQMHFNDLELRIRSYGLTAVAAILGLAGLGAANANAAVNTLILAAALVIWLAFFLMDLFWYHPMLKAAVKHGEAIEGSDPELGLTTAISRSSSDNFLGAHSTAKMVGFYLIIWVGLWVIFFAARTP